jgi:arylsulfatase A-like enzyme
MKNAVSLFLTFAIAKIAVLWGRSVELSAWTAIAYVWQDALVALLFGIAVWRWRRAAVLYWILAAYAAINIPIAAVLSTPLTLPMLRATSGTLADSILLYATPGNLLKIVVTIAAAAALPPLIARIPQRGGRALIALAIASVAVGPIASGRVDTIGLDRNVVAALAASMLPRVTATNVHDVWTEPPFERAAADALPHLRGIAAGRNVVLVSLESTGAQYLRLYGAQEDVTPNLDRLAESGVVFDHAYAVYPESIKGLFSVLCSTFPAFDTTPDTYETAPCESIATVLRDAGYSTALFHSGRFAYLGMQSIIQRRGFDTLADAGDIGSHDIGGNHESSFGVDEPATVARMLEWIDRRPPHRPFFLTYLPIAGHHPYETPEPGPFPTREEIGRYRNALHYGDRALGALRAGLDARGLDRSTVWIVIGDHGEALGQHEGNYGHTFFLFEENVRVPFIIAAPGAGAAPQRSRTMVSLVDTAPTLLDLLGIETPAPHQGRLALDGTARMALFFTDYSLGLVGLRDGNWKFVYEMESGRAKLFDLARDPREIDDVSIGQRPRVEKYKATVLGWSAAQKAYVVGRGAGFASFFRNGTPSVIHLGAGLPLR